MPTHNSRGTGQRTYLSLGQNLALVKELTAVLPDLKALRTWPERLTLVQSKVDFPITEANLRLTLQAMGELDHFRRPPPSPRPHKEPLDPRGAKAIIVADLLRLYEKLGERPSDALLDLVE
jgi:hypothetical protein